MIANNEMLIIEWLFDRDQSSQRWQKWRVKWSIFQSTNKIDKWQKNERKNTKNEVNGKIEKKEFFTSFLVINENENETENDAFFFYILLFPLNCDAAIT